MQIRIIFMCIYADQICGLSASYSCWPFLNCGHHTLDAFLLSCFCVMLQDLMLHQRGTQTSAVCFTFEQA